MLLVRILFCFLFLYLVNPQLQINLHLTYWENENENLQHDCLNIAAYVEKENDPRQIISYCMGELPSKFNITEDNTDQKLTFADLSQQHITSQQLYLWSAPIDIVEQYQFYLNQLPNSEKTTMAKQIFYNCTLPNFGPKCQYVLYDYKSHYTSLDKIIHDYYYYNKYEPTLFTCYIHLECNRGPSPSCLDWSEICDGKVDCLDGKYDEEHCWQLEIHQCNENEYQCSNGQCVSITFFQDDSNIPDCLDVSDENYVAFDEKYSDEFSTMEPTFKYEDVLCVKANRFSRMFTEVSCVKQRENLLFQAMFSIKPKLLSNECWTAMKCIMKMPILQDQTCPELCSDEYCDHIIQNTCLDIILVPAVPILFGHVYLGYEKNMSKVIAFRPTYPQYACYNHQLLQLPINNETFLLFNNTVCRYPPNRQYTGIQKGEDWKFYVKSTYNLLWMFQLPIYNDSESCNRSTSYQCINSSKCISKSRLFDGVSDCFHEDDEGIRADENNKETFMQNTNCPKEQNPNYFKCITTNQCISRHLVQDSICQCEPYSEIHQSCDDENSDISYALHTISFQTICDGFIHLLPQIIEGKSETDETNCESWPLINIYTRSDDFRHIFNSSDQIYCDSLSLVNCSPNDYICVLDKTNKLMCLPIEKVNDSIIDCTHTVNGPILCLKDIDYDYRLVSYCQHINDHSYISAKYICKKNGHCDNEEDEQVCESGNFSTLTGSYKGICVENYELYGSDITQTVCRYVLNTDKQYEVYFILDQSQKSIEQNVKQENNLILPYQSIDQTIEYYQQRCHRGLDLQVWLDKEKNLTTNVCLCPPSFYGDICQYQNQRVSLTLQFRVTSESVKIPFIIIISLIDDSNEKIIHSYEQFTYLSLKYCQRKFNIYLLYSTRPKNQMNNYLIHIDIYEKLTLNYRGSFIKPLNFPFLPIQRLAFQLDIPRIRNNIESCSDDQCINGKCIKYFNDLNKKTFCQCNSGWSGRYCTIKHICNCSSDSLCIGKLANNRSLCVCPWNKMGPRCLIDNTVCQNNENETCFNKGQCIPLDEYGKSKMKFTCICPKGFTGDQCEIVGTKLIVSFDKNIILPSSILIHFIEVKVIDSPVRTTTFKIIPIEQDSITIYQLLPFHIAFVELSNKTYYLTVLQKIYKQSSIISKILKSSDRCLYINELFNETIANFSLLRRIKYYHLPCQTNSSQLLCFYDEIHLCLCQDHEKQRVANCFEFNHNMNMDCSGQSGCENQGQCFQDDPICPKTTLCACPVCFYGTRCQLSTNGFSLSLDAILGYHIRPNITISHQPFAVIISLILTIIIIFAGLINGILSLITFKNKKTRESGCGIYLLCSSIITLFIMIIFTLKFSILIISQMGSIKNRLFLNIQCISIDFLLRVSLTMDQWLTAFISIERAYITIKGINFNKKKTRLIAKWIIIVLVLITIGTNIHDPIYRRLFDEDNDEEKRIWCIVNYPSTVIRIFNIVINIFHFIIPFIINLISAIIIIIINARQRAAVRTQQNYKEILNEQIQQHKNLLIGPCVLIIFGIPRLIISFASGCMKSTSDSWLFLVGYFISLIPPILTFILFVLPSTVYKEEFYKEISRYRKMIKRRS